MSKASSKKVQRAARAGGGARTGQQRALAFPASIVLVVVLGVALVVYARGTRDPVDIDTPPRPGQSGDHWHSAYAFYNCDQFLPSLTDQTDPLGIHSHGDGVIHIHPFTTVASGDNARLGVFFDAVGVQLDDDSLSLPTGEDLNEGDETCDGEDAILQVAVWETVDGPDAEPEIITSGFDEIAFTGDRSAYTIAFAPEGADLPLPPTIPGLDNLSDVPAPAGPDLDGDGAPDGGHGGAPAPDDGGEPADGGVPAGDEGPVPADEPAPDPAGGEGGDVEEEPAAEPAG